ncbi:MAG: hypothetical protein Q4D16_02100 [Eubacteriales bacterium]|nr:hypothetical protein [Eubacteriales bacterium]
MAFLLSIFSVAISGRNYGHYYEYLILFLIPVVLAIVKKWCVYFQKYLRHSLVIVMSLFVLTLMVNMQTPIRILGLTNVQKSSKGADAMGALYQKEYSHKKTMLVVNNKSMFYNKFNLIPEERYFYIPAIDYRIFPDAVDAQAESMLSGDNDILIISYRNYAKRWILPYGIKNKEILRCLEQKYQMVYEQNHIEMYVKKE